MLFHLLYPVSSSGKRTLDINLDAIGEELQVSIAKILKHSNEVGSVKGVWLDQVEPMPDNPESTIDVPMIFLNHKVECERTLGQSLKVCDVIGINSPLVKSPVPEP
jgi:hypothetical protein